MKTQKDNPKRYFRVSYILLLQMSAVSSLFKRTANNPRRFHKPWQLNDRIWKHCNSQARLLVSKICVELRLMPEKIINLRSRMTLWARIYRADPQNIGVQFGTLSGLFKRERAEKSLEIYLEPKRFRTIFEKRTTAYSLGALLSGLAKSIYYFMPIKLNRFKVTELAIR